MVNSGKILVVDDDPAICELLDISLTSWGFEVTIANNSFQALELLNAGQFNVTILDLMLPGPNGIEILEHIHERQIKTEVVMLTAYASLSTTIDALRLGAYDYITKPFQINEIRSTVTRALEKQRLETKLAAIYDLSREMALLLNVEQVAQTVLDTIEQVFDFKTCGLALIDEQQNDIYCLAVRGIGQETVPRIPLNGEKGIVAAAVRSRELIYVPDTRDDPRYVETQTTTRSELVVPLNVRGRVIGVLNAESATVDGFSQNDVRLLSILAAQTAVAIENARLHEQAQREITERQRAEEEIRRRRDHYRAVINSLHDQVVIIDRDYRISDVNDVFLRHNGRTREDVISKHCYQVLYQRDQQYGGGEHLCPVQQVWETGQPIRFTQTRYDQEGNARWLDVTASPLRDSAGRVTHVIEAYRDATAERQLEERLSGVHALGRELVLSREDRQIAQVTVDAAVFLLQSQLCGLWLTDEEERVMTPRAYAGRTESMNLYPLPLDDEESIVAAVARSGEPHYASTDAGQGNRSVLCVPLEVKGKVIGVLSTENDRPDGFDETDQRLFSTLADYSALALENARLYEAEREQRQLVEQSQAQLVQSEKLAATGRMAASLAHEINNPLQAIHNSLQLLLNFQLEPDEQHEYLKMTNDEVGRLIGIGTRILGFARRPRKDVRPTDLNAVIEKTLALAEKYFQHSHISLHRELSPNLPRVLAAHSELEQVFLNLALNAAESMPEGGTIRISSHSTENGQLAITFSDTGHGISPEHLEHIFEPFFSTKDDGTGLGLSVSYDVIKRHGGEITVQSVLGEGTTFTVLLPVMQE
ncbi:MAG: hypothetical protein DRI81_08350 [Chloroflexi bacterium]|nr:MAG: hypothetical protein DRI81_08350 [Chloroflexota bacterium]